MYTVPTITKLDVRDQSQPPSWFETLVATNQLTSTCVVKGLGVNGLQPARGA